MAFRKSACQSALLFSFPQACTSEPDVPVQRTQMQWIRWIISLDCMIGALSLLLLFEIIVDRRANCDCPFFSPLKDIIV